MSAKSYTFQNGESCQGVGIETAGGNTLDVITIYGSYPDDEYWARNLEARETVVVATGIGELALRGSDVVALDARGLQGAQAVVVEPGGWFRWHSTDGMVIAMECEPGFDAEKYEIKSEQELRNEI